jgi:hypothetical protein
VFIFGVRDRRTNVKKAAAALIGLSTLLLVSGCGSSSKPSVETSLSATMTPAAVVTPQGKPIVVPASLAHATGSFSGTVNSDKELSWHLSYEKLGKPELVVADIHSGPAKQFGPVLVRLCSSCKPDQSGVLKLKPDVAQQLGSGDHWVTLVTEKYPNGALRGQIAVK